MKRKRIVIVNDGLGPNKGDQAILVSMLDSLRKAIPEAETSVFPNSNMRRISQYLQFFRALLDADLFVFGGGQEIQDHASVAFLISGLLKVTLARLLSRPIFCFALGVGPVATAPGKFLTRLVLNQVDFITVRDESSRENLTKLGVTRPLCVTCADPALALTAASAQHAKRIFSSEGIPSTNGLKIAIAPRRWFHYQHYLLPMELRAKFSPLRGQTKYARLIATIARAADSLIAVHGAQVIFVPMRSTGRKTDPGQDDDRVSQEIINSMRSKERAFLVRGNYSPKDLKAFLGKMDLVIGMRMHSLIFASMMNVPVIGLALSPKFVSFMKMIGQTDFLLSPENLHSGALLSKVSTILTRSKEIRGQLQSRRARLHALASSNVWYLQNLLRAR